jgi:hypothetical protein
MNLTGAGGMCRADCADSSTRVPARSGGRIEFPIMSAGRPWIRRFDVLAVVRALLYTPPSPCSASWGLLPSFLMYRDFARVSVGGVSPRPGGSVERALAAPMCQKDLIVWGMVYMRSARYTGSRSWAQSPALRPSRKTSSRFAVTQGWWGP